VSAPWHAAVTARLAHRPAPDAIDCLIAAACFAGWTLPVLLGVASRGAGSALAVAAFGVLAAAPLVLRRRWPLPVLAAVAAVCAAAMLAEVRFTPFVSDAGPALAVAVFTVADRCPRRRSGPVTSAAVLATWALALVAARLHPGTGQDAVQAVTAAVAWLAGDIVRSRRIYRQQLVVQARRQAAEAQGRARAEERLRLSRDMHDVVSHSLSMIAVRSGVARLLLDDQPDEARAALAAIETASRQALDEVRQLLRQVREEPSPAEPVAPALADLPALAARLRASGLAVIVSEAGPPRQYGLALELSAYRIVQEALTNVLRHAPGARARLEIEHGPAELTICVTNDGALASGAGLAGAAVAGPRAGLGIVGMRERAALLGGQLTLQPRPGGGFAVTARLPVS